MDFLKSAVVSAISKGPLGAYSVGDKVDLGESIWVLNNAVKRDANLRCTLFTFDISSNRSRLPLARNAVRKARTLHHPGVVKVLDTIETDSQIYIITERLTPVGWYTRRKTLEEETVKWGLWSVAKTVKFINEDAGSMHGSVKTSAVFASESGEWKLGGFEILSSPRDEDAIIFSLAGLMPDANRIVPPEVNKNGWEALKNNPISAIDSYGFAMLVFESFHGALATQDQLARPSSVPPSMQQSYKRLLNANPKARLSVGHFLEQGRRNGGFFQIPLINLTEGIERLGLMTETERDLFLCQLDSAGEAFPQDFTSRKLLPELLKSVEFGGGGAKVFEAVLKIGGRISDDEYDTLLTPVLVRLFASADRAIRVCLLDNLHLMIDHLSEKIVNERVFPNLVTGFTDLAPVVREQTVKAVLTIITKLSDRVINGELLKYLAKTANDSEPGIRTNTTICLGKIAKYLGRNTRSKVLIAAFSRSLRDPFVHARNAALLALNATVEMFAEEDCANKILPAICMSLLDKEKIVRDQANKALDQYLQRIRKCAQAMPDTVLPPPNPLNGASSTTTPRMGTPANEPSSWTGWAISSFTNKTANAYGQIEPKSNGTAKQSNQSGLVQPLSALPSRPASNTGSSINPPRPLLTRNSTETTKIAASFDNPAVQETDAMWSNLDDEEGNADVDAADAWDAMGDDWDEEDREIPQERSSSTVASKTVTSPANYDDQGEPDFAGWLEAQQKGSKTSKIPLPKGLTPKTKQGIGVTAKMQKINSSSASLRKPADTKTTKPQIEPRDKAQEEEEEDDDGWGDAWE